MKYFLSFIGIIFLLFTCGIAVLVWKLRKHVRRMRDALQNNMDDETFRRMSDKDYWRKKKKKDPPSTMNTSKAIPMDGARRKPTATAAAPPVQKKV